MAIYPLVGTIQPSPQKSVLYSSSEGSLGTRGRQLIVVFRWQWETGLKWDLYNAHLVWQSYVRRIWHVIYLNGRILRCRPVRRAWIFLTRISQLPQVNTHFTALISLIQAVITSQNYDFCYKCHRQNINMWNLFIYRFSRVNLKNLSSWLRTCHVHMSVATWVPVCISNKNLIFLSPTVLSPIWSSG